MSRLGRSATWIAAVATLLFAFQLGIHVSHRLERAAGGLAARELSDLAPYLPSRVHQVRLRPTPETSGGDERRVSLPEGWGLAQKPAAWRHLALFVDGQRVPIVLGAPDEFAPLPRAFLRSRRASAVLLQCPPAPACHEAVIAWQDSRFTLALHASRLANDIGAAFLVLVASGGWLFVVRAATRTWPARAMVAFGLGSLGLAVAWFWTGIYATAWAPAILTAQVLLVIAPRLLPLDEPPRARTERALTDAVGPSRAWMWVGLAVVLLVNVEALSRRTAVLWDAREEAWFFLRFFGSAAREGHFGDYLPNVGSGYPVGANIVAGAYNPLYLLLASGFPGSALSANLLYLTLQALTFAATVVLGRTFGLSGVASWFLALSIVASGFFVGHASHFSYLSSGLGVIASLLGVRLAAAGRARAGAGLLAVSAWHLGTAGSPEHLVFGAHVLLVVWTYHLIRSPHRRSALTAVLTGVAAGALLASPALVHFFHQLARSPRAEGLSVDFVLAGSLPAQSLSNLIAPFMRRLPASVSLDPTMDRFHLLAVSPFLLLMGLVLWRKVRWPFWTAAALGVLFTLLSLGRHSPIPLREWLAEHFFVYRMGRAPAGQHRGFALFCFALASAIVLDRLWKHASPLTRRAAVALIAADFVAVMTVNSHVRFGRLPEHLQGEVPRFRVVYGAGEEPLLNAPRDCTVSVNGPAGQASVIPDRFTWSGYTNLISGRYLAERETMRWAICGPSRLWDHATRSPHAFALDHYTPG